MAELQKNLTPEQVEHIYRETGIELETLEITYDQLPESEAPEKMTPLEFLDTYEEIHNDISRGGKQAKTGKYEQFLVDAIARDPDVPSLRNMLRNVYMFMGKTELMNKTDRELYELFPDYLFARLTYARSFFPAEPETAYKIMGGYTTLSRTFPKRKLFHYSEVLNFYSFQAEYQAVKGNFDAAYTILDIMANISPEHHSITQTENVIEQYEQMKAFQSIQENLTKMMDKKAKKAAAKKKKK
jgi:tetratricopeptide (TPR) repeat protein